MSSLSLNYNKFLIYLNRIGSESIGFYFSFILHFIILVLAIGLPNFFKPAEINVPNIIPVEIINITEITSIPEKVVESKKKDVSDSIPENKKFNNSNNQEIKKIELKQETKVKIKDTSNDLKPKDNIFLKEKDKSPLKLKKEDITPIDEKIESLPSKKIKPKIKPQVEPEIINTKKSDVVIKAQPKSKPKPEFSIASMLKDLRNEKSTQNIEKKESQEKADDITSEKKEKTNENFQLSISEIDVLRQQLSSCWIAPAGAVIEKGMIVKISAKVKQNRRIFDNSVRIVDTNISKSNSFYGPITESAMRTLLNPDCIPLKLPQDKYKLWKNLTITFDYSIMKGYD